MTLGSADVKSTWGIYAPKPHRCRIGPCPPLLRLHDAELFALYRACRALPGAWPAPHCLEDTLLPSLAALHQPPHCPAVLGHRAVPGRRNDTRCEAPLRVLIG